MNIQNSKDNYNTVTTSLQELGRKWRSVNKKYKKDISYLHQLIHFLHKQDGRSCEEIGQQIGFTRQNVFKIVKSVEASFQGGSK